MLHVRSESQRHIVALDGVRGIAILGVLLAHSVNMVSWVLPHTLQDRVNGTAELGSFGVDLFFVLSGFLITGILLDNKESDHYFRNFYAKRFLRLFPVYYSYLLFTGWVLPVVIRMAHSTLDYYKGSWWWYLLYVSNWKPGNGAHDAWLGQFWSLAVEEQFYIVWPSVVLLLSRRHLAWLCGILVAVAFTLRCIWASEGVYWNEIYRLTVTRFDTIALGALVAIAIRSSWAKRLLERWAVPVGLVSLTSFCGVAIYARSFSWTTEPIQTVGSLTAGCAMAALIAYCAISQRGAIIRVLRSKFLTAYGKYSYGIYVYHPLVLTAASIPELRLLRYKPTLGIFIALPIFLLSQIVLFSVAKLSWNHFESPILRYKARFNEPRLAAVTSPREQAAEVRPA